MTDILRLSVPLTVWLASFSAIYGLSAIICSAGTAPEPSYGRAGLLAAWLFAIALQAVLLVGLRSPRLASSSAFVRKTSFVLSASALVATIWTLFPVVNAPLCL